MDKLPDSKHYSILLAAACLGVHPNTIRAAIKAEKLASIQFEEDPRKTHFIRQDDLLAWNNKRKGRLDDSDIL